MRKAAIAALEGMFVPVLVITLTFGVFGFSPTSKAIGRWDDSPEVLRLECERALTGLASKTPTYTRTGIYEGKSKVIFDLKEWLGSVYHNRGNQAWDELGRLGQNFPVLAIDPGIVFHLEEFVSFVRMRHKEKDSPWDARQAFSQYLGSKTVYRAIAITDGEASDILRKGILSTVLRERHFLADLYYFNQAGHAMERRAYGRFQDLFEFHLNPTTFIPQQVTLDPIISVSSDPDVGVAVASRAKKPGQEIYLATLSLPLLDIIYPSKDRLAASPASLEFERLKYEVYNSDGVYKATINYPEAESFVTYTIQPEEIVSFEKVDSSKIGGVAFVDPKTGKCSTCVGSCPEEIVKRIKP